MRRFVSVMALAALFTIFLAASASAAVTASSIDSPASPYHFYAEQGSPRAVLHVHGTATGTGSVDVNCYRSNGSGGTLVAAVPVVGGAFVVDVKQSEAYAAISTPCVLRAVPAGDGTARPPSATGDPFTGPTLVESWSSDSFTITDHRLVDFDFTANMLGGAVDIHSASGGAINSSNLFAPGTLAPSDVLFAGDAYFNGGSLIKIDGTNDLAASYLPDSASGPTPGWGALQYTWSLDPSSGAVVISSQEPAVKCPDISCTSYVSAGVELDRTVRTSADGHLISITDAWRSTNGAPHTLDATYTQGFNTANAGAAFQFPGASSFQQYAQNATVALPSGPGTVYVKEDQSTPDAGDGTHPQGAVSYATAPNSSALFSQVSANFVQWDAHYTRTVPASGALVLRFAYAQQYALADVRALAQSASASFPPSISVSAPVDGTRTASRNVTVRGVASDGVGVQSVSVNGQSAALASDGSWQVGLVLSPGINHITAVATNVDGITAQRQITLTYAPVVVPPPPKLFLLGNPSGAQNRVSFRLSCVGAVCPGSATLTATEVIRRRDGKVIGVSAQAPTRKKTVTVGTTRFTLQPGRTVTVTVPPNSTGRTLLKRFGRLPVKLSVALTPAGHVATTIATRRVTIKVK